MAFLLSHHSNQNWSAQDLFQKINLKIELEPWGSDHKSFLKVGIPAMLFINTDVTDKYEHYHRDTDDLEQCNYDEGKACIQLILAGLVQLVYWLQVEMIRLFHAWLRQCMNFDSSMNLFVVVKFSLWMLGNGRFLDAWTINEAPGINKKKLWEY